MVLRNQLAETAISNTRLSLSVALYSEGFFYRYFITYCWPYNPRLASGLGCSVFARRYLRNLYWFIFLTLLRCFSSDGILHIAIPTLRSSLQYSIPYGMGCPIRKPSDWWIITPPRRISLLYTSFFGMNAQGIRCQLECVAENKGVKYLTLCPFVDEIKFCKE
jgi:hypothetical protein